MFRSCSFHSNDPRRKAQLERAHNFSSKTKPKEFTMGNQFSNSSTYRTSVCSSSKSKRPNFAHTPSVGSLISSIGFSSQSVVSLDSDDDIDEIDVTLAGDAHSTLSNKKKRRHPGRLKSKKIVASISNFMSIGAKRRKTNNDKPKVKFSIDDDLDEMLTFVEHMKRTRHGKQKLEKMVLTETARSSFLKEIAPNMSMSPPSLTRAKTA